MKRLLVALALGLAFHSSTWARELRVTEEEVYCLALNDYYEARGEPIEGRIAVAYVVVNRLGSNLYPQTICGVVFQHNGKHCAFSWVCNRLPISEHEAWRESESFATKFLKTYRQMQDPTNGAVHYHEQSITPYWAKEYEYNIAIGDHLFYPKQVASK